MCSRQEKPWQNYPQRLFQEQRVFKIPISRACQSQRGSARTEQTSVPLSVCRLMQVNPCTRAVATALAGLVSLRWDRRASLTLLAQELRWLSSDSLPTNTESRPTQTKQFLRTVTRRRRVTCSISKRCALLLGQGYSLTRPAELLIPTKHASYLLLCSHTNDQRIPPLSISCQRASLWSVWGTSRSIRDTASSSPMPSSR